MRPGTCVRGRRGACVAATGRNRLWPWWLRPPWTTWLSALSPSTTMRRRPARAAGAWPAALLPCFPARDASLWARAWVALRAAFSFPGVGFGAVDPRVPFAPHVHGHVHPRARWRPLPDLAGPSRRLLRCSPCRFWCCRSHCWPARLAFATEVMAVLKEVMVCTLAAPPSVYRER